MNQEQFYLYLKDQVERKMNYHNNHSQGIRHIIHVICHKKKKSKELNEKVLTSFDGIASLQVHENIENDLHSYEILGAI